MLNVLNGGAHAFNQLEVQEFMIVPHAAPIFAESLRWGTEVYHALSKLLKDEGLSTAVGDEGFAPAEIDHEQALDLLVDATSAGYQPGKHISIALDCAASEFYRDECYHLGQDQRLDSFEWARNCPVGGVIQLFQ